MDDWDYYLDDNRAEDREQDPGLPLEMLAVPYSAAVTWLRSHDTVPDITVEQLADATAANLCLLAEGKDAEERTVEVERLGLNDEEMARYMRRVQQKAPRFRTVGRRAE